MPSVAETRRLLNNLEKIWFRAERDHNPQEQSPLFKIPAELRHEIFTLATAEYDDLSQPYERETYYWRPGFRGPRRLDGALLRSCRKIWLETRSLPMQALNEAPIAFFLAWKKRRPPEYPDLSKLAHPRARRLFPQQWRSLHTIQLYLQGLTQENLEGFFTKINSRAPRNDPVPFLAPSKIIMTTRYSDWLWWETQHPFFLDTKLSEMRLPGSVRTVVMEFEVIESREGELVEMLERVFEDEEEYRWGTEDGEELRIAGVEGWEGWNGKGDRERKKGPWREVRSWRWVGPTRFEGKSFEHHPPGDDMTYVVKAVTWEWDRVD